MVFREKVILFSQPGALPASGLEAVIKKVQEIRSIPTLMVFREKVILFSQPGALPASGLEAVIKKVQEIDMAEVRRDIATQEAAEAGAPS